jgi:hypothetical protein
MGRAKLAVRGPSIAAAGEVELMGVGRALYALPLWVSDLFVSHVDEACSLVWWSAYLVLVVTGARSRWVQAPC